MLCPELTDKQPANSFKWKDVEKAHIKRVLKLKRGVKAQVQRTIGYGSINTLEERLTEYGIDALDYE